MAQYANISIDQGSICSFTFEVINPNRSKSDLTGYTARAQMRKTYSSSIAYDFTCQVESPETEGKVTISMTAAETAAIPYGRYVYDVEIVKDSDVIRIIEGQVEINPRTTHPSA